MTLRIRVDVNGEQLGAIHIRNHGHPDAILTFPDDDDLRQYQCVLYREDHEPVARWVQHRRSEGWLALTRKAIDHLDLAAHDGT